MLPTLGFLENASTVRPDMQHSHAHERRPHGGPSLCASCGESRVSSGSENTNLVRRYSHLSSERLFNRLGETQPRTRSGTGMSQQRAAHCHGRCWRFVRHRAMADVLLAGPSVDLPVHAHHLPKNHR